MQIRVKRKKVSKIVSRFSFLQELFLRKFFDTCNASRSLFPSPRSCRKWQICEGREKRRGKGRKAGRRQTFSYFFFYFLWTTQYGPRYTSFQIATDRHKFFFPPIRSRLIVRKKFRCAKIGQTSLWNNLYDWIPFGNCGKYLCIERVDTIESRLGRHQFQDLGHPPRR